MYMMIVQRVLPIIKPASSDDKLASSDDIFSVDGYQGATSRSYCPIITGYWMWDPHKLDDSLSFEQEVFA
jgi:hypothetical protein